MMVILDDLGYLLLLFLSIVLIGNSLDIDLRHWLLSEWSRGTGRLLLLVRQMFVCIEYDLIFFYILIKDERITSY
jgi:hypothetical protein